MTLVERPPLAVPDRIRDVPPVLLALVVGAALHLVWWQFLATSGGDIAAQDAWAEFARSHPDRQEVRIVAGVTRAGASYCALRLRSHDDPTSVMAGADLVPQLTQLLAATLEPVE